jgi:hypothetical protein
MRKLTVEYLSITWLIVFISSCVYAGPSSKLHLDLLKTYEFFPGFFPQAKKLLPRSFRLGDYFRSFSFFQEVSTLAIFDIVPIGNELFSYYHIHRLTSQGYSTQKAKQYLLLLKQQLQKQPSQEIVLFILADIKVGNNVNLDCPSSPWRISLKIGTTEYRPRHIELVQSDKSLESILHHKFDRMKKIYKFIFCLPTTNNEISTGKKPHKLLFKYLDLWEEVLLPHLVFE